MSGIHQAILGRGCLALVPIVLQLVLYVKSQNCARIFPGTRATKNAVHTFCVVRYPWAVAAGLVGSRWVDLDLNHFWWHVFLQGKVSITRPQAQVVKIYIKTERNFPKKLALNRLQYVCL